MNSLFSKFIKDESGATAIEYGLIAALIALAVIGGASAVGKQVGDTFESVAEAMKNAPKGE